MPKDDPHRIAVAVLAAGQSRRFGAADKLLAPLHGKPLGLHVCDRLSGIRFAHCWVIAPTPAHPCAQGWHAAGFTVVPNRDAASGIGSSVALAGRLALEAGADGLLLALADMPLVPHAHYRALLARASAQVTAASHNGVAPTPPALFSRADLPVLAGARGDSGARSLLARAQIVACDVALLADIDDPAALIAAEGLAPPG